MSATVSVRERTFLLTALVFDEALKGAPRQVRDRVHDVLANIGNHKEARAIFQKALEEVSKLPVR